VLLGNFTTSSLNFAYGAVTSCGSTFQWYSVIQQVCNSFNRIDVLSGESHNPSTATASTYDTALVWAVPVSLAATQGIAIAFHSSRY